MTTNIENFADIETVKIAIRKFQEIGWPTYDDADNIDEFVEKITKQITTSLGKFPNYLIQSKSKDFPSGIFRVREITESTNFNLYAEHP
jgi:hypothetical protein